MLPQHCMRVHSYGRPKSLRMLSKSYGHGTARRSHVIYALYFGHIRWVNPGVPYGLCKAHVHVKTAHAEPVRISKPRKEPIRDQQGACTIILKAHQGSYTCRPICDPYGPVRLSTGRLRAKIVRSPCLKVRHAQLYGARTDQNIF